MLRDGHVPHEYRDYAKLLRKIGFGARDLAEVATKIDCTNPYVVKFFSYFERILEGRS